MEEGKLTVYIDVSKSVVSQLQTFGELGGGRSSHRDVHKSFLYSKPFVEKTRGNRILFHPQSGLLSYGFFLPAEAGMRTCRVGSRNGCWGRKKGIKSLLSSHHHGYLVRSFEPPDTSHIAQGA